jgi:hypothetical protein
MIKTLKTRVALQFKSQLAAMLADKEVVASLDSPSTTHEALHWILLHLTTPVLLIVKITMTKLFDIALEGDETEPLRQFVALCERHIGNVLTLLQDEVSPSNLKKIELISSCLRHFQYAAADALKRREQNLANDG